MYPLALQKAEHEKKEKPVPYSRDWDGDLHVLGTGRFAESLLPGERGVLRSGLQLEWLFGPGGQQLKALK